MKTVALKNPSNGTFQMIRLSNFGTISSDDREQYGTRVSLGNVKTSLDLKESRIVTLEDDKLVKDSKISALEDDKNDKDTRVQALELSAVGIVDGGRADLQHLESTDINGGSASL